MCHILSENVYFYEIVFSTLRNDHEWYQNYCLENRKWSIALTKTTTKLFAQNWYIYDAHFYMKGENWYYEEYWLSVNFFRNHSRSHVQERRLHVNWNADTAFLLCRAEMPSWESCPAWKFYFFVLPVFPLKFWCWCHYWNAPKIKWANCDLTLKWTVGSEVQTLTFCFFLNGYSFCSTLVEKRFKRDMRYGDFIHYITTDR